MKPCERGREKKKKNVTKAEGRKEKKEIERGRRRAESGRI
jgi:hypothetical protein